MSINDCFSATRQWRLMRLSVSLGDFGFSQAIEIVEDSISAGQCSGASRNSKVRFVETDRTTKNNAVTNTINDPAAKIMR